MKHITKNEAKQQELTYYYTGKPCKYGHLSERLVKGGACRECRRILATKYRTENREEYNRYCREKKKESYTTEKRREIYRKNILVEMFDGAKRRAKTNNIPFTIEIEDVIIPTVCPVLGLPFSFDEKEMSPSLDKKINELGYIKGNVFVVSKRANRLKNDASIDEIRKILKYMEQTWTLN